MHFLKGLGRTLLVMLAAAVLVITVSSIAEKNGGESLFTYAGMRVTVTGAGAAAAFLTILLFTSLRLSDFRKRNGKAAGWGERVNAAGFGLLPGAAVWKIFEQFTALSKGTEVFEPLPAIPFLIPEGRFATSRIELILAAVCFAAVLIWLIARRKDLPGNGDLLWTVLCVWGLVRALTESFRAEPLLRAGNADLMQILFLVLADAGFAVWTARRIRTQKSAVFTAAEWIAVLTCETVMVLNTAGVLSIGSGIGDLVMLAGCTVLCTVLILLCGKDSRY